MDDLRDDSFLGTGWTFPPVFRRSGATVEMVSGEEDVRESLRVIFTTRQGERVMLPDFGTDLYDMVFRGLTTTLKTEIDDSVRTTILNWEPRIDVLAVTVEEDPTQPGLVLVGVDYVIRRTNSRSNIVFPFYLEEGNLVAGAR